MANTVTVSKTQYEQLVRRVDRPEKIVELYTKMLKEAPTVEPRKQAKR